MRKKGGNFMRRRDPKDYADIDEVWCLPFVLAIIILVIAGLCFIIYYFDQPKSKDVKTYNEQAAEFNALPKSEREVFEPFCTASLDEELLIAPKKMPLSAGQLFKIGFPWFLLIEVAVCIFATFCSYWREKDHSYHLADLPFGTAYGWILLIIMLPIGWPFLLGSRIFLWRENRPNRQAEAIEVERLAEKELKLEGNLQNAKIDKRAHRVYTEFRVAHFHDSKLQAEKELREKIARQKNDIAECGKRIANLQHELGITKAELQKLEATVPSREVTKTEAESEWQQIVNMRGVAKITASKRKVKLNQRFLRILIKVRVPYRNELYDFGDYEVTFFRTCFKCRRVRSGVRRDHTNTYPVYNDSTYDFCFGSRLNDIEGYAHSGRIVEALTLIIDCFHSVNPSHEHYIPGCYRKVKTVEHAKKRLELQKFFQGGKKK